MLPLCLTSVSLIKKHIRLNLNRSEDTKKGPVQSPDFDNALFSLLHSSIDIPSKQPYRHSGMKVFVRGEYSFIDGMCHSENGDGRAGGGTGHPKQAIHTQHPQSYTQ